MVGWKTFTNFLFVGSAIAAAIPNLPSFPTPPDNPFLRPGAIVPDDATWCDFLKNHTSNSTSLTTRGVCTSRPTGVQLQDLAPIPGSSADEVPLDRDTLISALGDVASFLNKNKQQITLVGIGGVANVVLLQSRKTTHDVDFFNAQLSAKEAKVLTQASRFAQKKNDNLPDEWLNNRPVLFIPSEKRQALTTAAIEQNDVIFDRPGLKMFAGPWTFQFASKVDRIVGSGGTKPQDLVDAVADLHRFLQLNNLDSINESRLLSIAHEEKTRISTAALRQVDNAFARTFGKHVIVFGS